MNMDMKRMTRWLNLKRKWMRMETLISKRFSRNLKNFTLGKVVPDNQKENKARVEL